VSDEPEYLRPFLLETPACQRERSGRVDLYLPEAGEPRASGAAVEVIDVPGAHHGFETIDHTEPARQAVRSALRSVLAHLHAG
jgi:acetyl esterase/lipase